MNDKIKRVLNLLQKKTREKKKKKKYVNLPSFTVEQHPLKKSKIKCSLLLQVGFCSANKKIDTSSRKKADHVIYNGPWADDSPTGAQLHKSLIMLGSYNLL